MRVCLRSLTLAAAAASYSLGAGAAVTYHYTGNPFDQPAGSPHLGQHVTATVTFDDSVIGFTGTVDAAAVQSWAIRIAQVPGSEMGSATGAVVDSWPLYFVFDGGAITAWQVLARAAPGQLPEIYTTRDSPFPRIAPTGDFYVPARTVGTNYGGRYHSPGVWAVPEPSTWLLMALGIFGLAAMRRR